MANKRTVIELNTNNAFGAMVVAQLHVTRLGNLLDFGQLFKAIVNN